MSSYHSNLGRHLRGVVGGLNSEQKTFSGRQLWIVCVFMCLVLSSPSKSLAGSPAVTWVGNGDGVSWGDPANWSDASIPGSTNDVIISGLDPNVTIAIEQDTTVRSIQCSASLEVTHGNFRVKNGLSQIAGDFTVEPGRSVIAAGPDTILSVSGATTIDGVSLNVSDGATLSLPALRNYQSLNFAPKWQASGKGSVLSLPALTNAMGSVDALNPWQIQATTGGQVLLPALRAIGGSYEDFTIVVVPDTQYLASGPSLAFAKIFSWITNNAKNLNIQAVIGLGDIVDDATAANQWAIAIPALNMLEAAGIPNLNPPGNHDYDPDTNLRSLTNFNRYLPLSRYSSKSWYGGAFDTNSDNVWIKLDIGTRKFLLMAIEYGPRTNVLDWAKAVCLTNLDRSVLITTHSYLDLGNVRKSHVPPPWPAAYTDGTSGEHMWQAFVSQVPNVAMVFNGHTANYPANGGFGVSRLTSINSLGLPVMQMLSDFQWWGPNTDGGGMLRLLTYHANSSRVDVSTYSPYLKQSFTDADNQFSFDMANGGYAAVVADGTDSLVNLSGLADCSGSARVGLEARAGGTILAPQLQNCSRMDLTLQAAGQIPLSGVTNIDGASLTVSDGASLSLPNVRGYQSLTFAPKWQASGEGSTLSLPGLTNATGGPEDGNAWQIQATAGGQILIGNLANIAEGVVKAMADGAGSAVVCSKLQTFGSGASCGFQALAGGLVDMQQATEITSKDVGFLSDGAGSVLDLSALVYFNDGTIEARNGGVILAPNLLFLDHATLTVRNGGQFAAAQIHRLTQCTVTIDGTTLGFRDLRNWLETTFNYANQGTAQWPTGVDLTISGARANTNPLGASDTITVSWTGTNSSTDDFLGSWTDEVYLSKDNQWDIHDVLLGTVTHTSALDAGEGYTVQTNFVVPNQRPGKYYVIVRGDFFNQINMTTGKSNNISSCGPVDSMTFTGIVAPALGQQVLLAGQAGRLPVWLTSNVPVTNLEATVVAGPANRLANYTVQPLAPEYGSGLITQQAANGPNRIAFSAPPQQPFVGSQQIAWLNFTIASNQPSAFITIQLTNIVATRAGGTPLANILPQSGRVVVVGREPLLEMVRNTNGQPILVLYGQPSSDYVVEESPGWGVGGWDSMRTAIDTNLFQQFLLPTDSSQSFYRAFRTQ